MYGAILGDIIGSPFEFDRGDKTKDFEDAVRNAVSLGGDTDTLAAITGSIAEAYYHIPAILRAECRNRVSEDILNVMELFDEIIGRREKI